MQGLVITGHFAGGFRGDLLQDARAQQQPLHLRRLGLQNLFDQVGGEGAVFGGQFLDELVRVGVAIHGERDQAQARRPPLDPLHEQFQ